MRLLWVLCTSLAGSGAMADPALGDFQSFRAEMAENLLAGDRPLGAADVQVLIAAMLPAEKMQAVIYLRRLGLYTGAPIPLEQIVPLTEAPATVLVGDAEAAR